MSECDVCGAEIPEGAPCARVFRFGSEKDFLAGVNPTSRVVTCAACAGMRVRPAPKPAEPTPEPTTEPTPEPLP